MSRKKSPSLKVKDFYQNTKGILRLKPAFKKVGFSRKKDSPSSKEIQSSIQVWGKKDIQDLESLSGPKRKKLLRRKLDDKTFCVILAGGPSFFQEIKEEAKRREMALLYSELSPKKCRARMKAFFSPSSSNEVLISGELLKIFGLGVLIIGDAGIGKSESALELISRGCRFVSDDVVQVKSINGKLVGTSPPLTRNFMEIRGLGIINIREIFGPDSISRKSGINLVIALKKLQRRKDDDLLGLKFPEDYEVLGVKIPRINIPVAPGRNIATLIEVACKSYILKEKGYYAPHDLVRKLNRVLSLR